MSKVEGTKKMIRAVLLSSKEGIPAHKMQADYKALTGCGVPFAKLGYPDLHSFILSVPDVVSVRHMMGQVMYHAVADESTQHIQKMVAKQKSKKKKVTSYKGYKAIPKHFVKSSPTPKQRFLPRCKPETTPKRTVNRSKFVNPFLRGVRDCSLVVNVESMKPATSNSQQNDIVSWSNDQNSSKRSSVKITTKRCFSRTQNNKQSSSKTTTHKTAGSAFVSKTNDPAVKHKHSSISEIIKNRIRTILHFHNQGITLSDLARIYSETNFCKLPPDIIFSLQNSNAEDVAVIQRVMKKNHHEIILYPKELSEKHRAKDEKIVRDLNHPAKSNNISREWKSEIVQCAKDCIIISNSIRGRIKKILSVSPQGVNSNDLGRLYMETFHCQLPIPIILSLECGLVRDVATVEKLTCGIREKIIFHRQEIKPELKSPKYVGPSSKKQELIQKPASLEINMEYEVFITHINDCNDFFVRRLSSMDHFKMVTDATKSVEFGSITTVYPGMEVISRSKPGKRSRVMSVVDDEVEVYNVDFGDVIRLRVSNLAPIPEKIKKIPELAVNCCLYKQRENDIPWSQNSSTQFQKLCFEEIARIKVISLKESSCNKKVVKHSVTCYIDDFNINVRLIREEMDAIISPRIRIDSTSTSTNPIQDSRKNSDIMESKLGLSNNHERCVTMLPCKQSHLSTSDSTLRNEELKTPAMTNSNQLFHEPRNLETTAILRNIHCEQSVYSVRTQMKVNPLQSNTAPSQAISGIRPKLSTNITAAKTALPIPSVSLYSYGSQVDLNKSDTKSCKLEDNLLKVDTIPNDLAKEQKTIHLRSPIPASWACRQHGRMVEVLVTNVVSPGSINMTLIDKIPSLNDLTQKMNAYYEAKYSPLDVIESNKPYAALCPMNDGLAWQRVLLHKRVKNLMSVFLIDRGMYACVPIKRICNLSTQFEELQPLSITGRLAGIKPRLTTPDFLREVTETLTNRILGRVFFAHILLMSKRNNSLVYDVCLCDCQESKEEWINDTMVEDWKVAEYISHID